jgi:hypothetical protein
MAVFQFYAPCDPGCPEIQKFVEKLHKDAVESFGERPLVDAVNEFEAEHILQCERCMMFGTHHIGGVEPVKPAS